MHKIKVILDDSMKRFVKRQVREGGYINRPEYVRALIRRDRDTAKLRQLLRKSSASLLDV